jgi:hypothetical protein
MEPCVSEMCGGEHCAVNPTSPSLAMHGEEEVYITAFCFSRTVPSTNCSLNVLVVSHPTSPRRREGWCALDLPKPKSTNHKILPQHPRISVHNCGAIAACDQNKSVALYRIHARNIMQPMINLQYTNTKTSL